jgi:hypothetical protein
MKTEATLIDNFCVSLHYEKMRNIQNYKPLW